jgi:hypothetical protein
MNLPRCLVIHATFGQKPSLTIGSCLGPMDTTNLTQPLLLSGTFGHNKPPSALAPIWDLWTQQTSLSPCSCLGPLDTTNLPQPLLLSGTFGHNKPTLTLAPETFGHKEYKLTKFCNEFGRSSGSFTRLFVATY